MKNPLALYKQFFIDKQEERLGLFEALQEHYAPQKGLYPGSFVHISPSFIIPEMVYVDSDRRCPAFFASCAAYLGERRLYRQEARYRFHHQDFASPLPEEEESFDLLISLYSGFVSESCAHYLRSGGLLLANDSHGDASLARLNPALTLSAVVEREGEVFSISTEALGACFRTRSGKSGSGRNGNEAEIRRKMRGPAYTRAPYAYIFRKN